MRVWDWVHGRAPKALGVRLQDKHIYPNQMQSCFSLITQTQTLCYNLKSLQNISIFFGIIPREYHVFWYLFAKTTTNKHKQNNKANPNKITTVKPKTTNQIAYE